MKRVAVRLLPLGERSRGVRTDLTTSGKPEMITLSSDPRVGYFRSGASNGIDKWENHTHRLISYHSVNEEEHASPSLVRQG